MFRPVLSIFMSAVLMAGIASANAGQTGAFSTVTSTMWACADEQAIARVMVAGSPAKMRIAAREAGNCTTVQPGTNIWVHGGNALIEWGGVDGYSKALYYPVAGVSSDPNRTPASVTSSMWACADEQVIASIMAARSSSHMRRIAKKFGSCVILKPGTIITVQGGNAIIGLGSVADYSHPIYFPMAGISKVSTATNYKVPTTSIERVRSADTGSTDKVNLVRIGNATGRTGKLCKAGISTLMGRDAQTMYSGKIAEQDDNDIFKLVYWRFDGEMFSYHCLLKGNQIIWKMAPDGRWRTHPLDEKLIFDESLNGSITITMTNGDGSRVFTTKTFHSENL